MKATHPCFVALAVVAAAFAAPLIACGSDPSPSPDLGGGQAPAPTASPPGSPPPPSSPPAAGPSAKSLFLSGAEPLLRPTCNACHASGASGAPIFLGATPEASYTAITSNQFPGLVAAPANSKLLSHGAHLGPALTKGQVDAVTIWLNAEAKERGLDVKPAYTEADALRDFAACMRFGDFAGDGSGNGGLPQGKGGLPGLPGGGTTFANIADAETDDQGACRGCHNTGDGTFWASSVLLGGVDMTQVMFDRTKESPYIRKLVVGTTDASGAFVDLTASDAIAKQAGVAAACVGPGCHPKFTLSQDQAQAIHDFVETTLQRWRNKQCSQPIDAGAD